MDQIKIGKFIAEERKAKKYTQRELADKLSISDKTISKWERGNGFPEVSLLLPLCNELEITVNELLSGERLQAMDYKKKSSSRHEFVCTEDISEILEVRRSVDAEEVILRKEKKEFMYMVLERFREEQPLNYEILIQVKYLDIPVEIVAEEFGLTKSGVNNRIYKAKRWLKEEFRKVYE